MNNALRFLIAACPLALLTAACTGAPAGTGDTEASEPSAPAPADAGPETVLFTGDSIAVGQSLPLAAAFAETPVAFHSIAAEGGGNVVGPFSEENWETLPGEIEEAAPDVVVYQITTYDWGTREEQARGYGRLADTAADAGADLVIVTAPPIRPDDFYAPHMDDLARAPEVAREVARDSAGRVVVLDATTVWGEEYSREREGLADRSPDGIHTCPQGAARFTDWLLDELAGLYPGFAPPRAQDWAEGDWAADDHFAAC
ncbi:SGNH/GDSL hydrolase family protein [Nocardiopsis sp. CC223A]|uniref:SGNH/GDSL hydrolase family protein n=1 Tax=Nocardiopsis sp. CC223A TaxID=3044051 RepID=UPI00278C1D24|nr:SGNH/GDSL hydrolase family protein [Nocardiopsis sp. CC223A]